MRVLHLCKNFFTMAILMTVCVVIGLQIESKAAEQPVGQQYLQCAEKMRQEQEENRESVEKWIDENQRREEKQGLDSAESGKKAEEKSDTNIEEEDSIIETGQYDMEKAYQVNRSKMFLITEYQENGFPSCITDEVLWKVPYDSESGRYGLALFGEDEGGFEFFGASVYEEEGHMEAMPPSDDVIAKKMQSAVSGEEIQKIQYVYSDMYCATLIYIVTSQNEYIIPYAENEDMYQSVDKKVKLQNGEVYTLEDFMKEMNQIFDEKSRLEGNGNLNYGGMPYREPRTIEVRGIVVTVVSVVVIGIIAFLVHRKQKNTV